MSDLEKLLLMINYQIEGHSIETNKLLLTYSLNNHFISDKDYISSMKELQEEKTAITDEIARLSKSLEIERVRAVLDKAEREE